MQTLPEVFDVLIPSILAVLGFILVGYGLSRILKRNDIADFLWGLGFVLMATVHSVAVEHLSFRGALILAGILIWGFRLSLYLGIRIFGKKTEDIRYVNFRTSWGTSEPLMAFLKVFLLQGVMMGIISLPVIWGIRMPEEDLGPFDFLGASLFVIGFVFETIADLQLAVFKRNPLNKGKVMNQGLWAYSRHPNYFGEVLVWWGLFFICVSLPYAWITALSPLLITFLLTRVSGVPMLEKVLESKGNDFKEYLVATPTFFPFRRKEVLVFGTIIFALMLLDFCWLNLIMGDFYRSETVHVARMLDGQWDVIAWAMVGVYFFIALGVRVFAVTDSALDSIFRGALLGIVTYSIYEFTNLSLVSGWPLNMAIVDIGWGCALCAIAAGVGYVTKKSLDAP